MAINPPSDIIADVISAAEPGRAASVEARLKAMASSPVAETFSQLVDQKRRNAAAGGLAPVISTRMPQRTAPTPADPALKSKQAAVEFEGAILGILFSEIVPKNSPTVLGKAQGADMWHSMLSGEIGRAVAKSGVLKLHERLFRTHPVGANVGNVVARAAQMSDKPLSRPLHAEGSSAGGLALGMRRL